MSQSLRRALLLAWLWLAFPPLAIATELPPIIALSKWQLPEYTELEIRFSGINQAGLYQTSHWIYRLVCQSETTTCQVRSQSAVSTSAQVEESEYSIETASLQNFVQSLKQVNWKKSVNPDFGRKTLHDDTLIKIYFFLAPDQRLEIFSESWPGEDIRAWNLRYQNHLYTTRDPQTALAFETFWNRLLEDAALRRG